jgi:hypothetical protein
MPGKPGDPLDHLSREEADLFVRFLVLIRDNYKKADKAAHFLERKAGITNTCSMANLRDVLSHMATLLDPATPPEHRADQLASAEEHLRRAIIEPYEIALAALTEKFGPTYDGYREKLIPIRESTEGFRTSPNRHDIDNRLQEIDELAEKAKHAKGRNKWDAEWELGIISLIDAYRKLAELHAEIEEWIFRLNQHQAAQALNVASASLTTTAQHHTRLHKWGIAWTIAALIVGIAFGFVFARYAPSLSMTQPQPTRPAVHIDAPRGTTKP